MEGDAFERFLAKNLGASTTPDSDTAVLRIALGMVGPWKRSSTSMPRDGEIREGFGAIFLPHTPAPRAGISTQTQTLCECPRS